MKRFLIPALGALVLTCADLRGETLRIVTYNLRNYSVDCGPRTEKPLESRLKIRESIRAARPDILAVQEVCGWGALSNLQTELKAEGLDLPNAELVTGFDTNIQIAVLSRFPFASRTLHTNDLFLLDRRRHKVGRGFGEFQVQVKTNLHLTLFTAHLKSRRAVLMADEAEERLAEATLLREKIDARLTADPAAAIVVLGDLNDAPTSAPVRKIIGRGKKALVDARPTERHFPYQREESGDVGWTHYYSAEETCSRIDYVLVSQPLAPRLLRKETYVLAMPGWQLASDHRPVVATIIFE